jgi:hypothetical protein
MNTVAKKGSASQQIPYNATTPSKMTVNPQPSPENVWRMMADDTDNDVDTAVTGMKWDSVLTFLQNTEQITEQIKTALSATEQLRTFVFNYRQAYLMERVSRKTFESESSTLRGQVSQLGEQLKCFEQLEFMQRMQSQPNLSHYQAPFLPARQAPLFEPPFTPSQAPPPTPAEETTKLTQIATASFEMAPKETTQTEQTERRTSPIVGEDKSGKHEEEHVEEEEEDEDDDLYGEPMGAPLGNGEVLNRKEGEE